MSRRKTKRRVKIPFNELDKLKTEPGAEELAQSPVMEPLRTFGDCSHPRPGPQGGLG